MPLFIVLQLLKRHRNKERGMHMPLMQAYYTNIAITSLFLYLLRRMCQPWWRERGLRVVSEECFGEGEHFRLPA